VGIEKDFSVNVFEYTDYRKFLHDTYTERKTENRHFSYRFIAYRVGFKSAGHFTKIIQGKANISPRLALRFAEFLKLNKRGTEYFQYMVLYNQAKHHSDKRYYFEKMRSFKDAVIRTVHADHYEFYDKWYYSVIREVLAFLPVYDNFAELASQITPTISYEEAERSITLLTRLGFIYKNEAGRYVRSESLVISENEVRSLAINSFTLEFLNKAKESIDRFPRDERLLSTTLLTVSKGTYQQVCNELREFRRRILKYANDDTDPERTYSFNFQVFPVSKGIQRGSNGNSNHSDTE
jgi:uncharacterized protein (TIGR02147 family)